MVLSYNQKWTALMGESLLKAPKNSITMIFGANPFWNYKSMEFHNLTRFYKCSMFMNKLNENQQNLVARTFFHRNRTPAKWTWKLYHFQIIEMNLIVPKKNYWVRTSNFDAWAVMESLFRNVTWCMAIEMTIKTFWDNDDIYYQLLSLNIMLLSRASQ